MNLVTKLLILIVPAALAACVNPPPAPPPGPTASPDHELYAVDQAGQQVLGFELRANGSISPNPTHAFGFNQASSLLKNPIALTVNPLREMWVVNRGVLSVPPVRQPLTEDSPSVTVYDDATTGTPIHVILTGGPGPTQRHLLNPVAAAWRNGPPNLILADAVMAKVWEYAFDSVPTGSAIGFTRPSGVAVDNQQRVYVSDRTPTGACVWRLVMAPHRFDQVVNLGTNRIVGPATQLRNPGAIAVDAQENLYVLNEGNGQHDRGDILVFAPGATGNVAPIRRIFSTDRSETPWRHPRSVAVGHDGRIFVSVGNRVLVFAAGANGDTPPDRIVESPLFGDIYGIAVR